MSKSRKLAYAALIYNAIIWGAAFPIVKPVFNFLTPLQYLYFRYLLAGILSLPVFIYFYIKKHPKISKVIKPLLIELGGLALPIIILYEGLNRTSALEASLIGATGPLFVILGGVAFLRERESKREWQGLALSLLGSLILILEPVWNGHEYIGSNISGNLLILGYNVIWAVYAVVAKKVYKTKPPLSQISLTFLATALIHGLILTTQNQLPSYKLLAINHVLLPILYMAIPAGIIPNLFYLYAVSRIEVSEANLFTYLHGVVAIPTAFLLLGETPSLTTLLAISIIAYGVYRAERKT
ncbi:MAG: DMT family transporter [Candidatus Microgenomates bacterium]